MGRTPIAPIPIGPPTDKFVIQRQLLEQQRSHCGLCNWSSNWYEDDRAIISAAHDLVYHVKERHPEYDSGKLRT